MYKEGDRIEVIKGQYDGVKGTVIVQNGTKVSVRLDGGGAVNVKDSDIKHK